MKELEAKLKELETKQSMNDRCFMWVKKEHKETGDKIDEETKALEKQNAEGAKPKLRHGQFITDSAGGACIVIGNGKDAKNYDRDGDIHPHEVSGVSSYSVLCEDIYAHLDDLKALQEDVTGFEVRENDEIGTGYKILVRDYNHSKGEIVQLITNGDHTFNMTHAEFYAFTLNCRKKEATLKREQAKK